MGIPAGWRQGDQTRGWSGDRPLLAAGSSRSARVELACTTSAAGDLRADGPPAELDARRRAVLDGSWTWLRQVHGCEVVTVTRPGEGAGSTADGAVSAAPGAVLAVTVADCAPVAFWSPQGVVGVAHAGWRGLLGGVLERTVDAMARLGATEVSALVGPCIGASCYEFGPAELASASDRLGAGVAGVTAWGTPALDVVACVRAVLAPLGIGVDDALWRCTACASDLWSWRARGDRSRQALALALRGAP